MSTAAPDDALAYGRSNIEPLRGTVGLSFGNALLDGSDYNNTVRQWGYNGFRNHLFAAVDGGAFVTPWLLVGGRFGYGSTDGDGSRTEASRSLTLSLWDVGLMVRVGAPIASTNTRWFLGAQGEVGAALATISLRQEDQRQVLPRYGIGLFTQVFFGRFGVGVRTMYRSINWSEAGGIHSDLYLGGIEMAASLEVRL